MSDIPQIPDAAQEIREALASIQPGSPEASEITANQIANLNAREAQVAEKAFGPIAVDGLARLNAREARLLTGGHTAGQ
jgi:hypothetical protein